MLFLKLFYLLENLCDQELIDLLSEDQQHYLFNTLARTYNSIKVNFKFVFFSASFNNKFKLYFLCYSGLVQRSFKNLKFHCITKLFFILA